MDNNKKELILNKIIGIGFVGYFLILLLERIFALIYSFKASFASNSFLTTTYIITIISIVLGTAILIKPIIDIIVRSCSNKEYDFGHNCKQLIIGSMVLLVSGMMHTDTTYSIVQFIAYGFLIISMIVKTYLSIKEGNDKFAAIMSLIYLVAFSMAIPVCYPTKLDGAIAISFYVIEFIATFILIPCFGLMLYNFFINGICKFELWIFSIVTIFVSLVLGLKWIDEINIFVLIAFILTVASYLTYKVKTFIDKRNK